MTVDANLAQSFFHVLMMEFLFLQVKDKKPIVISNLQHVSEAVSRNE